MNESEHYCHWHDHFVAEVAKAMKLESDLSAVRKELEEAKRERAALSHDIDRHIAIASMEAERAETAESALAAAQKDAIDAITERDEWVIKWTLMRRQYAELRYPGMTNIVRAADAKEPNIDEAIRALSAQKDGAHDA
jgi:seryl-tRNA synthetase